MKYKTHWQIEAVRLIFLTLIALVINVFIGNLLVSLVVAYVALLFARTLYANRHAGYLGFKNAYRYAKYQERKAATYMFRLFYPEAGWYLSTWHLHDDVKVSGPWHNYPRSVMYHYLHNNYMSSSVVWLLKAPTGDIWPASDEQFAIGYE